MRGFCFKQRLPSGGLFRFRGRAPNRPEGTMTEEADKGAAELAALKEQLAEAQKGIDALKAKNEELITEKREAQKKAKAEAEAAAQAAAEAAAKSGDVEALNRSWQAKLDKREAELADALKARDAQLVDLTVGATAAKLAGDLAVPGSADVLLPHIKCRLAYQDGKLAVLDAEGKPSASTVDELANEIRNDKRFAPLIVASMADGGGAAGSKGGGAANKNPFAKGDGFNLTEQARLLRDNPTLAARLKSQAS